MRKIEKEMSKSENSKALRIMALIAAVAIPAVCDSHCFDDCRRPHGTSISRNCICKFIFSGTDYLSANKISEGYGRNMGQYIQRSEREKVVEVKYYNMEVIVDGSTNDMSL